MRISDWSSDVCSSDLLVYYAFRSAPSVSAATSMIPRSQAGRIDVLELEAELADVVAETGFDVARLVKATFHELRDACLGRKALNRFDKNIPLRRYVCVGGQTGDVHDALGVDDGSLF